MKHFSARLPEEVYSKARVLAAVKQISMNDLFIASLQTAIKEWEKKHGSLPTHPED